MAILSVMEDMYKGIYKDLPDSWNTHSAFLNVLLDLDFTSSPGYPYMLEKPTIGDWLGYEEGCGFNNVQVQKLWHDVQLVMRGDYEHIFRAFVKDEPHKIAKAEQNRWRLIIASSLPVQIVWRLLFKHQNTALNANPYLTPSKHGLVFCYGGWMRFLAMVHTQKLVFSRDISGWDVNAPGWVLHLVGKWRESWPGITLEWKRLKDMMYEDAYSSSRILFSNGVVVRQQYAGFMKSGCYNTIADNSLSMIAMHILACLRSGTPIGRIAATGDDVMQSHLNDSYLDCLERTGCRVKEVIHHIEFMGNHYKNGFPEPMYFQKHLVNYITKPLVRDEVLDAYCRLYAYSDKFGFWKRVAELARVQTHTSAYYKFWYSSPMAKVMKSLVSKH